VKGVCENTMREQSARISIRFRLAVVAVSWVAVGLGLAQPELQAATYYVSTFGDNDNDGSSLYDAFDIGAYEYVSDSGSFRVLDWKEQQ
jgi:hypothetical protein